MSLEAGLDITVGHAYCALPRRSDVDVAFVNEMLVAPILARMSSGSTEGLDPKGTSRRIVDLIYGGIQAF